MTISIAVDPRPAGAQAAPAAHRPPPSDIRSGTRPEEKRAYDAAGFFISARVAKKVVEYGSEQIIFAQGDFSTSVRYLQQGSVKLVVVNETGKEAVVAILGPGDFLGEGCLAGQSTCMATAITMTPATVLVIEKHEMMRVLHEQREFCDRFMAYMLARKGRVEEDLVDQLFNSSEKRLARALLLVARHDEHGQHPQALPAVSQEMLAEMIGTTRSRVNLFMNKFRKQGFIKYGSSLHGLQINKSLLGDFLNN